MRKLLSRPRSENRSRRHHPISQAEVAEARHRAWREASLPRINL